ncbi:MBL fold metallo-hydrolase [Chryseobacterium sp. MDT2-18]|uniref:MBL fold metallo-hydrolase n=1 Tax=Chryseobacterium sp. MDT2-18 TaxID=1259136 RepID=UPI002787C5BF|nr:MBL fold metallo-hydrolase [Chryseobacterium sp. MDT2-18]MDQ0475657.1 L-ascorbate metabolism protein UlaG (beta-lactamase superfamily) [Chryseobacterium sp. MDT2-18]
MMIAVLLIAIVFTADLFLFMQHPKFGKAPTGKRLERIKKSRHYQKGKFDNINFTPQLAEDASIPGVMFRFLFGKNKNLIPKEKFNFEKTDLKNLNPNENIYVWMGHSSYFIQIDGKKILVDPVFSGNASPVKFAAKAFSGTDLYAAEDIPELDYLIITHDHWDHLDYETVKKLNPKAKQVITGLGTGEHLEYWNYDPKKIIELDWGENFDLGNGFKVYAETARHFSGRGFKRNQAIWASFIFETPERKIYIGGDSGFDNHFEKIGNKYGGFDLAILENGQYNKDWRYIHMMPEEFLVAAKNLKAKRITPVHNSKFTLALHDWKEPLQKITALNEKENLRLITPKIGGKTVWQNDSTVYEKWWESYK